MRRTAVLILLFAVNPALGQGVQSSIHLRDATNQILLDSDGAQTGQFTMESLTASRTWTLQDSTGTFALDSDNLGFFSATTSLQLKSVISDESGNGFLLFNLSPTITTPALTLVAGVAPTPTSEGLIEWESDDDHLIIGDGVNQVEFVPTEDISGDVTMDIDGAVTIAAGAVTNAKLAGMAEGAIKMRVSAGSGDPENVQIGTGLTTVTAASGDLLIIEDATDSKLKRVDAVDFITTLAGTPDYITISGQTITRGTVDISDDTNLAAGTGATLTGDSLSVDLGTDIDTSEIVDNTIGLADWESGTAGNMITFDASGDPAYVATGTATQVLTSNGAGAAPTFQAAAAAGEWTDLGTVLHPNETGDDVALGNTTLVNAAKLSIDGDADQNQLTVQGFSTQTDSVVIIENSSGTEVINMDVDGTILTAVGLDAIGAVDMDYGSADVTDHTFLTDGTGTAEIVLPAQSIDSTEILDATIATGDMANNAIDNTKLSDMAQDTIKMRVAAGSGDPEDIDISAGLSLVTAVSGDFVIIEDATDGNIKRVDAGDFLGGGVTWDAIGDAAGNGDVLMAETVQSLSWDSAATAAAYDAMTLQLSHDSATDASTQRGLVVERLATTGTATWETLVQFQNNDTDGAVTTGLEILSAAGAITTAIDVSDAEIGTAISIGANDIVTAGGTVTQAEFDILQDGLIDLASEVTGTLPIANGGTGQVALDDIVGGTAITVTAGAGTIVGGDATVAITDDSVTFAQISDSSAIDADTTFTAADGIGLVLQPTHTSGDTNFLVIDANQTDDAAATDDFDAMRIELISESGDAGDTMEGLVISQEAGTANTVIDAAIRIENLENLASTMTDAIKVEATTADAIVDGLDVSDAEITNAINIGANPIAFSTGSLSATDLELLDDTVIDNTELANMAQDTIKMRVASGTGDPEDIDISTGLTLVTGVAGDFVIIEDATDGNLKRVDVTDFISSGGEWTDTGTILHPTETGDDVVVGGTTLAGGVVLLRPSGTSVFNEQAADLDFRIKASGEANAFFLQGSDGFVGISTGVPTAPIHLVDDRDAATNQTVLWQGNERGTPTDDDEAYLTLQLDDSAGSPSEFGRMTWRANDVTNTTKDGEIRFSVPINNVLTDQLNVNQWGVGIGVVSSGASLHLADVTDFNANQAIILQGNERGTPADDDEAYITLQLDDSAGTPSEFGRITWEANDVTNTTKDGEFRFEVMADNSLTERLRIDETNVTVTGALDVSGALTLGTALAVAEGGTGATTLTDGGILLGSGTGAITALGAAANGQLPIGDGTTDPVLANITAEAGGEVTVTNGAGTIELDVGADSLDFAEITDSGSVDADTTFTAADGISLTLTPTHTSGDTNFLTLDSNQTDDVAATDDFDVMRIEMISESGDAGDTYEGLVISQEAGTANTVIDAAIRIENLENAASTMTDGIKIEATTADAIVDGVDVSDAELTNAINLGANPIAFSTGSLSATDLELLDDGAIDLASEVTGTLPVANGGTGAITLDDIVEGTAVDVTAGVDTVIGGDVTVAWDSTEINDTTFGDNTDGVMTWTFDPATGANPVLEITFDGLNMTTGTFAVSGNPVVHTGNNISSLAASTSAQLAGNLSNETGTGLAVFGTSPTIVTPTIASFANANHNHQDAAGGGTLAAAAIVDDSLTFAQISDSSAIDADTTFTAADGIGLVLQPTHTSGDTNFLVIDANQTDDAAATDDFDAMRIELISESGDAGDTLEGLVISQEAGTANTVIDAGIRIENLENAASTMTDAIKIEATTADAIVDGVDVSDAELTNAINIGANPIAYSTGSLSATDLELLDDGAIDLASEVTGTLPVANGGTGATTLTDGGILLGSGTGAITALGAAANGQIPIGDGTTDPVLAGLTGGTNLTVVDGAGSITLNVDDAFLINSGDDSTTGDITVAGGEVILGSTTQDGTLVIHDDDAGGDSTVTIQAADATGTSYTLTLPPDDGDAGEQLQTNGAGVLTWEAAGSGAGAFSDAGDPVVLNTTTKDVHVGDGAGTLVGKLEIGGDADQPQLVVEGFSTQTDSLAVFQNDADTQVATVDPDGLLTTAVGLDAIGAVDMDYGSADVTDHTFVTDSTGTAEIVLPAGAIDTTEILDDTIDAADMADAITVDGTGLDIGDGGGTNETRFGTDGSVTFGGTAKPKKRVFLSATAGLPTTTAGCADAAQAESTTNKVNYMACAFDGATDENWQTTFTLPENYDAGTFTAAVEWTGTHTAGDTVTWVVSIMSITDDDVIDTAFGTGISVSDDTTATGDFQRTAETSAITASGSPAGGDRIWVQVTRDADADDDTDDGQFMGVWLVFTVDALSTED